MESILVYGDSLSWGIVPGTRQRLPFVQRWPGVCEATLNERGWKVRIIEDCLNGRRTVYEDPFKEGRNGKIGLRQRMEVNSPLDLVLLMLGTNDFQFNQPFVQPWTAAQGVATLVQEMRLAPIEPGMSPPEIVVICPPPVRDADGPFTLKFQGAAARCQGLADAYEPMARELGCRFFDAGRHVTTSDADGVHLDADSHRILGRAIGEWL
jgi:lysophospholipase L1-like esterase